MITIAMPSLTHWSAIFAPVSWFPSHKLEARNSAGHHGLQTQ